MKQQTISPNAREVVEQVAKDFYAIWHEQSRFPSIDAKEGNQSGVVTDTWILWDGVDSCNKRYGIKIGQRLRKQLLSNIEWRKPAAPEHPEASWLRR